jgi:carbon monoxide dehydrogenase subunit G
VASIYREFIVQAAPEAVWAALGDFGAVHTRLATGFVTGCVLEEQGAVRLVTFANGMRARERLVARDDGLRRLAYTVEGGRASHHNASAQVLDEGDGRSRVVWITDLLPDALAPAIAAMMDAGVAAMRGALETGNSAPAR